MDDYILIDRDKHTPAQADMCITIDNDFMQPYIKQGSQVFVSRQDTPEEFEVGLFLYRGQIYCRQWCEDYSGAVHLLCANPKRESCNIIIDSKNRKELVCMGKVLLKKTLPPPVYGRDR